MGSHQMYGTGGQLNAEVGYWLPVGVRFVGTLRVGYSASLDGRDYRVGYALGVLGSQSLQLEVGIDAQRRESPQAGGVSNGLLDRARIVQGGEYTVTLQLADDQRRGTGSLGQPTATTRSAAAGSIAPLRRPSRCGRRCRTRSGRRPALARRGRA